jgi:hypothetical protein
MLESAASEAEINGMEIWAIITFGEGGNVGIKVLPGINRTETLRMFELIVQLLKEEQKNVN